MYALRASFLSLQVNVVDFLMKTCGFSSSFSEAEVHRAIGIIRTNCIHVQPQYLKNQVKGIH